MIKKLVSVIFLIVAMIILGHFFYRVVELRIFRSHDEAMIHYVKRIDADVLRTSATVTGTVHALFSKYKEDDEAADEMFTGAVVEVAGPVQDFYDFDAISRNGRSCLRFRPLDADSEPIYCDLQPSQIKKASMLVRGAKVVVKAKVVRQDWPDPLLAGCVIVNLLSEYEYDLLADQNPLKIVE